MWQGTQNYVARDSEKLGGTDIKFGTSCILCGDETKIMGFGQKNYGGDAEEICDQILRTFAQTINLYVQKCSILQHVFENLSLVNPTCHNILHTQLNHCSHQQLYHPSLVSLVLPFCNRQTCKPIEI